YTSLYFVHVAPPPPQEEGFSRGSPISNSLKTFMSVLRPSHTATTELVTFLSSTELFQSVSVPALQYIATRLEILSVPCGAHLIPKEASHDDLHVVINGTVAVTTSPSDGTIRFLKTLGPGESAGGWLGGGSDSTEFTAVQDTIVGRFAQDDFDPFAQQYPDDAHRVMQSVIQSLHRS